MTARSCPVCGSTDDSQLLAEENLDPESLDKFAFASRKMPEYLHYRLVICPDCNLAYANPAPDPSALESQYAGAAYDSGPEAQLAAATYAGIVAPLMGRISIKGEALDIGAGDGAFLEQLMKMGFERVTGVEPSAAPIKAASDEVRSLIRREIFSAENFGGKHFSLVTCFQTIEHLPEPLEVGRAVYSLLEGDGVAVFVCHNRNALSAKLMGRKSPIFDIEHLQLFDPKSIQNLLKRSGFENIELHKVRNRYPLRYWARLFPMPGALKKRVLKALAGRAGGFVVTLPAGNIAAIGFKRL